MRLINFAPFRSHAVPYFLHSNIMPITMLYFKLSSMLMFDVYNNTAPHNILHLFIPTQQIHSYSTRSSSSGNYYISHSRLTQKNGSFSMMGAKIWNSIPENLRNSSKSLFKKKIHTILLKIFEVQDRYADLNTISLILKNISPRFSKLLPRFSYLNFSRDRPFLFYFFFYSKYGTFFHFNYL